MLLRSARTHTPGFCCKRRVHLEVIHLIWLKQSDEASYYLHIYCISECIFTQNKGSGSPPPSLIEIIIKGSLQAQDEEDKWLQRRTYGCVSIALRDFLKIRIYPSSYGSIWSWCSPADTLHTQLKLFHQEYCTVGIFHVSQHYRSSSSLTDKQHAGAVASEVTCSPSWWLLSGLTPLD